MTEIQTDELVFQAPGPGCWELETTHHGLRPLSHLVRDAYVRGFETGIQAMLERYGLPLAGVRAELVEGCFYVRPVGVGEGSKPGPTPPTPILKLIARLHPELRRRNRTAKQAWAERRWRAEVDGWFEHERGVMLARNLELQAVDPAGLDDIALADHLAACLVHFADGMRRNLDTHGGDLLPSGDLLAHGERWGIDAATLAALLIGWSPATIETVELLRPVSVALAAAAERPLFDSLLDEARYGHRQREDIRGLCWNWPGGLARRAMIEAGRRFAASGRLHDPEHAAELTPEEIASLLRSGTGPSPEVAADRAARRDRVEAAPPPRSLGDPEDPPPFDAFPAPLARAAMALMSNLMADASAPQTEPLHGTGIGERVYRGRACVVRDAWEAVDRLQPGDVLIAPFTGPSFNSLLPVVGALVVEEGGPMCHAAIVSREFDIPALVGALGATGIADGTMVEVDPVAGVVRVV
jgi:pyruvate,water dikinase